MPRPAHDPYTAGGRAGLRRVVNYERSRFGWVRGTVADRILTALEDQHARPALYDSDLASRFDSIACDIIAGNVSGVAVRMVDLVDLARRTRDWKVE